MAISRPPFWGGLRSHVSQFPGEPRLSPVLGWDSHRDLPLNFDVGILLLVPLDAVVGDIGVC